MTEIEELKAGAVPFARYLTDDDLRPVLVEMVRRAVLVAAFDPRDGSLIPYWGGDVLREVERGRGSEFDLRTAAVFSVNSHPDESTDLFCLQSLIDYCKGG